MIFLKGFIPGFLLSLTFMTLMNVSAYFIVWRLLSNALCMQAIKLRKMLNLWDSTYYFANKGPYSQSYGFSSSHVWMWELDRKESRAPKNWCFLTALEKTESPLDCKEIQPVHPKGNQSWIFIGRTDAEAEAPILWRPDVKNWLIRKDPDAGKDKARGEGDNRGWDGCMASPTWWTWVWASSRCWW